MNKDIDPFEEEDWEELELNANHIYDVVYGCMMSYYTNEYMNYNLIKKNNDEILLKENDDDDKSVCTFKINENNDKVEILYDDQSRIIKLIDNIDRDKFSVFLGFRVTFDKYLKDKNDE